MAIAQTTYPIYIWGPAFIIINILIFIYLLIKNSRDKKNLEFKIQEFQEKVNILRIDNTKELESKNALMENTKRYNMLREMIERIDQHLSLESIAEDLVSFVFSVIAKDKGACILYRLDSAIYKLFIYKTKKEDKGSTIKPKEGDIFDKWVLKHSSPLFIEDAKRDFRFDLDKIGEKKVREICSLISSPLLSANRLLGVLRLDNPATAFYSQDDLRFLVTISDLGAVALENGELFQRTQELAIRDELTSLYTRRYFRERLKEDCAKSIRQAKPLSLLMLDIDHFKVYNDKFGHTSGDIVLRSLSNNIINFLKHYDNLVCRFGGEEFCIILPGLEKKKAQEIAEGIRMGIEQNKITLRQKESTVTVSIGVASFPVDASDAEELILIADRALYEAKKKGRNRVCTA